MVRERGQRIPIKEAVAEREYVRSYNEPLHLMYNEFRWQRRLLLGIILALFFMMPGMMWWLQTDNVKDTGNLTTTQAAPAETNESKGSVLGASSSTGPATITCGNGNCVSLQTTSPVTENGNISISGSLKAGHLQGDGSSVTNVNAASLNGQTSDYYTDASHLTTGSISSRLLANNIALTDQPTTFTAPLTAPSLAVNGPVKVVGNSTDQLQVGHNGATTFAVTAGSGATTIGSGLNAGQLTVNISDAHTVGEVLQAASGQTADLLQAKDANGQTVARVDAQGNATFTTVTQTGGVATLNDLSISGDGSLLGNVGIGGISNIGARLQVAVAPAQIGLIVKGSVGQLGDLLQLQNSSGLSLLRVDAGGVISGVSLQLSGSLTVAGHIRTGGTVPTIGTLLPGIVPVIVGNDTSGTVTVTSSFGAVAGIIAHVNFASPYSAIPKVMLTANSATAANLPVYVVPTLGGFDIVTANVPSLATVYTYSYFVVQ